MGRFSLLQKLWWADFLESGSPEAPCVYAGVVCGLSRHGPWLLISCGKPEALNVAEPLRLVALYQRVPLCVNT